MSTTTATVTNLGFLTILRDGNAYLGGYLVTNSWGRPLEFRLSSPVQPNRIQQILYGASLEPYICGNLIGKTLVEKTATAAEVIVTDFPSAHDLRLSVEVPVALINPAQPESPLSSHGQFASDKSALTILKNRLGNFDFAEPFGRIREAIAEARKMNVAGRFSTG